MSNDYCDDLMPRNAPKPAPLNEVTAKPTVPEVSLLLDQEKNKSFHLNGSAKSSEAIPGNSEQNERDQNKALEILNGNQFESYSTWKAKNALALHTITGSLGNKEPTTIRIDRSGNLKGERSKPSKDKELSCPQRPEGLVTSPMVVNQVPKKMHSRQASKPREYYSHVNENFPPRLVYNDEQQNSVSPSKVEYNGQTTSENYTQSKEYGMFSHKRNFGQFSNEQQPQRPNPPVPLFLHPPVQMFPGAPDQPVHSYGLHETGGPISREIPDRCIRGNSECQIANPCRNNTDHKQCQCSQDRHGIDQAGGDFIKRNPIFSREAYQTLNPMLVSPQNIAQINNQTIVELYNIIHLQNEQILMLQTQVKEMLKLHLHCGKSSPEQNLKCGNCCCKTENNNNGSKSDDCSAKESAVKCVSDQKKISSNDGCNVSPKRSIGVNTSSIEERSPQSDQRNVVVKSKNLKSTKSKKSKKKQESQQVYVSPSSYKLRYPSCQGPLIRKEKGNKRNKLSLKKSSKEESNGRNEGENSLTLNEAELPVGTDSEDDDLSPFNSVNWRDYCNVSDECADSTAESSSGDDDDDDSVDETETEGYSSDPQLGWTFYNQVVGQVNNILKKKPTPPRRERGYPSRLLPNHLYMDGGHEIENNWSKRVTFDGPSIEDSENMLPNMMNMPRNQARMGQDFRPNGGPMMQDFRMYNIADGNSNLSFATLRRLEHYNLMPQNYGVRIPDQSFSNSFQKKGKKSHKKFTKYREPETYHHTTPHQKKKTRGPSSKLLDITAIKQQPKLF